MWSSILPGLQGLSASGCTRRTCRADTGKEWAWLTDRPKAPRLQHSCHTAFITHGTSAGLEGVLSVGSPVNRMGVLWDHRHDANLHFSSWFALLSGVWGWYSLHTLYTDLTGRERRMPATTLKTWKTREKKDRILAFERIYSWYWLKEMNKMLWWGLYFI